MTQEGRVETATLAGGCFWCLDGAYRDLRGVIGVESGYAGGQTANPTYEQVCSGTTGHAEVVRVTAQALGRRIRRLHIPTEPVVILLDFTERLGVTLPIKAEQIRRLNEDKAFSHAEAQEAFGYSPIAFEEGIRKEVALFRAGRDGLSA